MLRIRSRMVLNTEPFGISGVGIDRPDSIGAQNNLQVVAEISYDNWGESMTDKNAQPSHASNPPVRSDDHWEFPPIHFAKLGDPELISGKPGPAAIEERACQRALEWRLPKPADIPFSAVAVFVEVV